MVVPIGISFSKGLFSGAMLVEGGYSSRIFFLIDVSVQKTPGFWSFIRKGFCHPKHHGFWTLASSGAWYDDIYIFNNKTAFSYSNSKFLRKCSVIFTYFKNKLQQHILAYSFFCFSGWPLLNPFQLRFRHQRLQWRVAGRFVSTARAANASIGRRMIDFSKKRGFGWIILSHWIILWILNRRWKV